jgi:hypothetical protein
MGIPDSVHNDLAAIVRFFQPKFRAFQQLPPTDLTLTHASFHTMRT